MSAVPREGVAVVDAIGHDVVTESDRHCSISIYNLAAGLVCVVRVDVSAEEKNMVTIEDLRHSAAEAMDAPPSLLKFLPCGDIDAVQFRADEDLIDVKEVQAVVCDKRTEYLAQGKKHIDGDGVTKGELLEHFLWKELEDGCAIRCAFVRPQEEVSMDNLLLFGTIFENFQNAEKLEEIFYLFDLQTEIIDPLMNVLQPLDEILESDRPDKTGGFIAMVVDWVEALHRKDLENEVHVDCFFQALLKHVERNPAFWTLSRRRLAWRRDATTDDDEGMTHSALWDVFGRIIDDVFLGTWPVLWAFMQRFAGITITALKSVTVPGLQSATAIECEYVPYYIYDAMRDQTEHWVDARAWLTNERNRDQQKTEAYVRAAVDFWASLMELYSVKDIKAIREGSHTRGTMDLQPGPVKIDFLDHALAKEVPFLVECRRNLGECDTLNPWLSPHEMREKRKAAKLKIAELEAKLARAFAIRGPKVGDTVEIQGLQNAVTLNRKVGRVIAFQQGEPMRYQIQFEDGSQGRAVKASNLKLLKYVAW